MCHISSRFIATWLFYQLALTLHYSYMIILLLKPTTSFLYTIVLLTTCWFSVNRRINVSSQFCNSYFNSRLACLLQASTWCTRAPVADMCDSMVGPFLHRKVELLRQFNPKPFLWILLSIFSVSAAPSDTCRYRSHYIETTRYTWLRFSPLIWWHDRV